MVLPRSGFSCQTLSRTAMAISSSPLAAASACMNSDGIAVAPPAPRKRRITRASRDPTAWRRAGACGTRGTARPWRASPCRRARARPAPRADPGRWGAARRPEAWPPRLHRARPPAAPRAACCASGGGRSVGDQQKIAARCGGRAGNCPITDALRAAGGTTRGGDRRTRDASPRPTPSRARRAPPRPDPAARSCRAGRRAGRRTRGRPRDRSGACVATGSRRG